MDNLLLNRNQGRYVKLSLEFAHSPVQKFRVHRVKFSDKWVLLAAISLASLYHWLFPMHKVGDGFALSLIEFTPYLILQNGTTESHSQWFAGCTKGVHHSL